MITIDDIIRIAEEHGWSVDISYGVTRNKTDKCLEFEKYIGSQDFLFSVWVENDDITKFVNDVKEYADDFDIDEETSLWIGNDGHGRDGAPYRISDILKEMQEAKDEMEELAEAFRRAVLR